MKKNIMFGIGGLVIGLLLSTVFGSDIFSSDRNNHGDNMMMNNIDQHFIEQMIPHHESAVVMAELALKKSKHAEIKTLAGNIIQAQNKEIKEMSDWYKNWFRKEVPNENFGMMDGAMMSGGAMHGGSHNDVSALENALDFDKAFIEAMIPHHESAVVMAQMLQSGTSRPEMLQLAKNIIDSQSKEIVEMKGWYQQWYK